jgi:DNA-directed RNA polymerase subunit F
VPALERELVGQRFVPYVLAKELMHRRVAGGPTGALQERVWDYLREFGEGDPELARRAYERLTAMGIPEAIVAVILSICPKTRGELLSIYQMDKEFKPNEDHFDPVLEVIEEFCKTTPYY